MDIYESLFSQSGMLNEQIASQIFDILPEQGPIVVIMDRDDNCWVSNPELFSKLTIGKSFLEGLFDKIDDGDEPVMTQVNDTSIIGSQLVAEQSNCGYVIIVLPQYSPESTLINIDLIEILLNQTGLIARLIEKNHLLRELQMKQFSLCGQGEASSN